MVSRDHDLTVTAVASGQSPSLREAASAANAEFRRRGLHLIPSNDRGDGALGDVVRELGEALEASGQADGRQPFEDHPKLAAWIEKLANRRIENFSHASWCAFLGELNAALSSHAMLVELERREAVRQTEARLLAEVQPAGLHKALRDLVRVAERVDRIHAPREMFGALAEAKQVLRTAPAAAGSEHVAADPK